MSLIGKKSEALISLCCASILLEEIISLKTEWIEAAQKPNRNLLRLI
jgi:hypothetical protein